MVNYFFKYSLLLIFFILFLYSCSHTSTNPQQNKLDLKATKNPVITVTIPSGSFNMGNTGSYSGFDDEKPIHKVNFMRTLNFGIFEITQTQWKEIMGSNPSRFIGDSLPVENVSFRDAINFCNKLSVINGLQNCYKISDSIVYCDWGANGWRIPSEAEWEYACKAGSNTDFYNGILTHPSFSPLDENLDKIAWYSGNAAYGLDTGNYYEGTRPVGLKQANQFGLYDMIGNVLEWVWDEYMPYKFGDIYDNPTTLTNINAPRTPRGGCWDGNADVCRSSNRQLSSGCGNGLCYVSFGLRIVRKE
ncbi:MAG: formylglycine-generating enzyme family protein [Candidatus Kapabacteria bacterium]|nr:formylglycine-generating enzyme family protein [Candidatus Kapabacteria bacterium]